MDPASAIGVAAAVLQFVEVGAKAIKTIQEVSKDVNSATRENKILEQNSRELEDLRARLGSVTRSRGTTRRLLDKAHECARLAQELVDILTYVRGSGQGSNKATAATRALRYHRQIIRLRSYLEGQEEILDKLVGQDTNVTLHELRQMIRQQHASVDVTFRQSGARTRKDVREVQRRIGTAERSLHRHIDAADKRAEKHRLAAQESADYKQFLRSLWFPEMDERRNTVGKAVPKTFDWIFDMADRQSNDSISLEGDEESIDKDGLEDPGRGSHDDLESSDDSSDDDERWVWAHKRHDWDDFSYWLRRDSSVYWISGKAGSGKSTLMAFILDDGRTYDRLNDWKGDYNLHTLSYFFWRPGSDLQKSIRGLLRSLLFQICNSIRAAAMALLADLGFTAEDAPSWDEKRLSAALKSAMEFAAEDRFCIFLDGLDEFTGNYHDLIDLIFDIQRLDNVKVCVSSRPEIEMRNRLAGCETLMLHDLNDADIRKFVRNKLRQTHLESADKRQLVHAIAHRAGGVFLWAVLVSGSVSRGADMADDFETLMKRLEQTPAELKNLFRHMISKVDDALHRETLTFYIWALLAVERMTTVTSDLSLDIAWLTAAKLGRSIPSYDIFSKMCQQTEAQVVGQSCGLLVVTPDRGAYALQRRNWLESDRWFNVPELYHPGELVDRSELKRTRHLEILEFPATLWSYIHHRITWVHRSAYDYTLESGSRLFSAAEREEDVLARLLDGKLNLLAMTPSCTTRPESGTTSEVMLSGSIRVAVQLAEENIGASDEMMLELYRLIGAADIEEFDYDKDIHYTDTAVAGRLVFWRWCLVKNGGFARRHLGMFVSDATLDPTALLYLLSWALICLEDDSFDTMLRSAVTLAVLLGRGNMAIRRWQNPTEPGSDDFDNRKLVMVAHHAGISSPLCFCESLAYRGERHLILRKSFMEAFRVLVMQYTRIHGLFKDRTEPCSRVDIWALMIDPAWQFLETVKMDIEVANDMGVPRQVHLERAKRPALAIFITPAAWRAVVKACTSALEDTEIARTAEVPLGDLVDQCTLVCFRSPDYDSTKRYCVDVESRIVVRPGPNGVRSMVSLLSPLWPEACSIVYGDWTRLQGSDKDLKALQAALLDDIWANGGGLDASQQLFALACVRTRLRETFMNVTENPLPWINKEIPGFRRLFTVSEDPTPPPSTRRKSI